MTGSAVTVVLYRLIRPGKKWLCAFKGWRFPILGNYRTVGQSRPGTGAEGQRHHRHEETDGPLASDRLPAGAAIW